MRRVRYRYLSNFPKIAHLVISRTRIGTQSGSILCVLNASQTQGHVFTLFDHCVHRLMMNIAAQLSSRAYFLVTESSFWTLAGCFSFLPLRPPQLFPRASVHRVPSDGFQAMSPASFFLNQNQDPVLFSVEMFFVLIRIFLYKLMHYSCFYLHVFHFPNSSRISQVIFYLLQLFPLSPCLSISFSSEDGIYLKSSYFRKAFL